MKSFRINVSSMQPMGHIMIKKLTLAILGILCIAGCGNSAPNKTAASAALQQPTEQPAIKLFHTNLMGQSGHAIMTFDARQTPKGIILKTWKADDKRGLITRKADEKLLIQLDALVQKHNVRAWNGQMTDTTQGAGYDILVQYTDNRNISTSCFGATPPAGMEAFWQDLYTLREEALSQYRKAPDQQ